MQITLLAHHINCYFNISNNFIVMCNVTEGVIFLKLNKQNYLLDTLKIQVVVATLTMACPPPDPLCRRPCGGIASCPAGEMAATFII